MYVPVTVTEPEAVAALFTVTVASMNPRPWATRVEVEPAIVREDIYAACTFGEVDVVVHFAASSHVDNSIAEPELFVLDNVLGELDLVLIMSVNPGFGGQSFIPGALAKLRCRRASLGTTRAFTRAWLSHWASALALTPLRARLARESLTDKVAPLPGRVLQRNVFYKEAA